MKNYKSLISRIYIPRSNTTSHAFFGLENIFKVAKIDPNPRNQYTVEKKESKLSNSCHVMSYSEVLMEIRSDHVAEIKWLKNPEEYQWEPEGDCIVIFRDGNVIQSYVPINDIRAWFALENHNVETGIMPIWWSNSMNSSITVAPEVMNQIRTLAPIAGLGLIFAVTQWTVNSKGDVLDRIKLRREKQKRQKLKRKEALDASVIRSAYEMADKGKSVLQIEDMIRRYDVKIIREEIEALVLDSQSINQKSKTSTNTKSANLQKKSYKSNSYGKIPKSKTKNQNKTSSLTEHDIHITSKDKEEAVFFSDVAGIDDERYELEELITFFHEPEKFRASGAKIPRGLLLCGPPGTGKTLLARAVAGESGAAFLSVNASEFVEMFAGVGAARVRDLFSQARLLAPAIIFIDEIDAIGRPRGSGAGSGTDERDQTLIQLLSLMDGFETDTGVILIGATNRRDILDPALIRPGRFDRIITMGLPHQEGRVAILETHLRALPVELNLDIIEIAQECQGFTGAQLANLVNIAASNVSSQGNLKITNEDLFSALDFERLGPIRSNALEPSVEKRLALLESATAIAASLLPTIEEVWMVTIMPRDNNPAGKTVLKLNQSRHEFQLFSRNLLEDQLVMELAGRAAEIILSCKEFSLTNHDRISNARRIVNKLLTATMSDSPTSASFRAPSLMFEGPLKTTLHLMSSSVSNALLPEYDELRQRKMNEGIVRAINLLSRNRAALDELSKTLLAKKILRGSEVRDIIKRRSGAREIKIKEANTNALT